MPLLINKDGKQLGPYSLDQARALVLSGEVEADDWAWPDGATDWVPLKEVPGFVLSQPAASAGPATSISGALGEEELWRGHPSQILNFSTYFLWFCIIVVATIVGIAFAPSPLWTCLGVGILSLIGLSQVLWAFFHLRAIEYVVTTQRVRVISGLFSKDIQEIELFRVKDTMAKQSFFLRLFGLGTITIVSGDANHPRIVLTGIPRAIELRERIRQEVMTLRQRFGVRELDVM